MQNKPGSHVIVGVDGSPASIEALIQGQGLAAALGAEVHALACWEFPQMYGGYVAMGIGGFEERVEQILAEAVQSAFGTQLPSNLRTRLVNGGARQVLLDASKDARMLVVGRRGHGGFGGLLLGSVSSACVAHADCPVLVVHTTKSNT
jgi:nucleotide-binding universal stress UspA family protein